MTGGDASVLVLSASDRLEILELYARYCHSVDALEGEAWAACFTPDGAFHPCTGVDAGTEWAGTAKLVELGSKPDREDSARHWTSNIVLDPGSDRVYGRCYGMRVDISGPRARVVSSVVYHDEIVRHEGRWLFRSRRPRVDVENRLAELGAADVDGAFADAGKRSPETR